MDPNANLAEQVKLAQAILRVYESGDTGVTMEHDAARLAELVLALNEWIAGGGFLPRNWAKK